MKRANEIASEIRSSSTWDMDLCAELCELSGLPNEWSAADGETFEQVLYRAAEILGVEII